MEHQDNTPQIEVEPMLSESEKLTLRRAIVRYGMEAPSEEDAMRVFEWAHMAVINHAFLGLVLEGEIEIRIREDGELLFRAIPNTQTN